MNASICECNIGTLRVKAERFLVRTAVDDIPGASRRATARVSVVVDQHVDIERVVRIGPRPRTSIDRGTIIHHFRFDHHEATAWNINATSIFRDGNVYRMYYKAWHLEASRGKLSTSRHPLFCCYAESDDGIKWRKPNLGLHEFQGSKNNNIVMLSRPVGALNVDAGHPAVFKDANPKAADNATYKAIVRSSKPTP